MKLGVIVPLSAEIDKEFEKLASLGFPTCQLNCWDLKLMTEEYAEKVKG